MVCIDSTPDKEPLTRGFDSHSRHTYICFFHSKKGAVSSEFVVAISIYSLLYKYLMISKVKTSINDDQNQF